VLVGGWKGLGAQWEGGRRTQAQGGNVLAGVELEGLGGHCDGAVGGGFLGGGEELGLLSVRSTSRAENV
jgi:hypothetical protein